MKVVVTGATGLIGWHAMARLHADNCSAIYKGLLPKFEIVGLSREDFNDDMLLSQALRNADGVLHFAGVNRGDPDVVEAANPQIAKRLVAFCNTADINPHIVYANSVHYRLDSHYGRSKRAAKEIFAQSHKGKFTDLVLPHIFGEGAKPNYNNVTATFISKIYLGESPNIDPSGQVQLLHAGEVAEIAINAVIDGITGQLTPKGTAMSVSELFRKLTDFHESYSIDRIPLLSSDFEKQLFNTYRFEGYPDRWPRNIPIHVDDRGRLFEAQKGGSDGQVFLSTTRPGVTRGDHFHFRKVERFLVLQGEAKIRMRRVLGDSIMEFSVSGEDPTPIDMPTLHTHSIENIGEEELITLFWSNEIFDPLDSDTFADKVIL